MMRLFRRRLHPAAVEPEPEVPSQETLVVRIRKDSSVELMSKTFPRHHGFKVAWLNRFETGVVTVDDETIRLRFANARATYRIVDSGETWVTAELVDARYKE